MRQEIVANLESQVAKDRNTITRVIKDKAKEFSESVDSPAKFLMPRPDWDEIYKHEIEQLKKAKRMIKGGSPVKIGQGVPPKYHKEF